MENAFPNIEGNTISESAKCGVCYGESSGGRLTNNIIRACEYSNVGLLPGSNATLHGNKITDSKQHGVLAKTGAKGSIEGNTITGNMLANVKIEEGAETVLGQNK